MKKKIFSLITIMLILVLAACKKDNKETEHNHSHEAEVTLRVALLTSEDEAHYKAVEQFAKELETKSNGKIGVSISDIGELGSDEEVLEYVAKDADKVDIVISDFSNLTKYETKIDICEMPFAFVDYNEAREFMDGEIQAEAEKGLTQHNMKVLAHYTNGFHYLITTDKRVNTPRDLQGMFLATSDEDKGTIAMRAMGAQTYVSREGEVAEKLRQGNGEGYEGTINEIFANRIYQTAKCLTVTNHSYSASGFIIAESSWNKLSEENQQIIKEAAVLSSHTDYEMVRQQEQSMLEQMESAGVRINEPNLRTFWEKAEPVVRGYSDTYGNLADKLAIWKSEK